MTSVLTIVLGYLAVQEVDVKNQSSLSRRGDCLLVQVYFLPHKGNSRRPTLLIASLNRNISFRPAPSLFLSSSLLSRLKSPTNNQSRFSDKLRFLNQVRKSLFPVGVHGAQTDVNLQQSALTVEVKSRVTA